LATFLFVYFSVVIASFTPIQYTTPGFDPTTNGLNHEKGVFHLSSAKYLKVGLG
jgi:hypothetical protein